MLHKAHPALRSSKRSKPTPIIRGPQLPPFGPFLCVRFRNQKSGKRKQHKHKLFGPDFPRTFLTLTPGCPGVKKFLPITGAAEKHTFWCRRPRFSARTSMTRRVLEKLCTKKVCVDFLAPKKIRKSENQNMETQKSFPCWYISSTNHRNGKCQKLFF